MGYITNSNNMIWTVLTRELYQHLPSIVWHFEWEKKMINHDGMGFSKCCRHPQIKVRTCKSQPAPHLFHLVMSLFSSLNEFFLTLYNMFLQLAHHVRVVKKTSPFWIVSTSQDQLWPSWYFRVQMDPNGMQLRMGFEPFGYKTGL